MRLGTLIGSDDDRSVTGFAIDHRKVAPGTIFGAFRGSRFNGEDFIAEAIRAGAVAVVARPEAPVSGAVHKADAEAVVASWLRALHSLSRDGGRGNRTMERLER